MAKPLILVIDDEREFADNITEMIRQTGNYEAITAYSAREALHELEKHKIFFGLGGNKIKLILLDIKMPDLDGLQFLELIRKRIREDTLGVIMLTAFEDEEKWEKATSGFVAGYIKKTAIKDQLLSSINRFFSGPDMRYKMTLDTFETRAAKKKEWHQEQP